MENSIGGRLNLLIDNLGIKKVEFAQSINVDQSFISQITAGKRNPSDRTIADICRVFSVSEAWLREGIGEMFLPVSEKQQLAALFAQIEREQDDSLVSIMVSGLKAYYGLSDEKKAVVREMIDSTLENLQNKKNHPDQ